MYNITEFYLTNDESPVCFEEEEPGIEKGNLSRLPIIFSIQET